MLPVSIQNEPLPKTAEYFATRIFKTCSERQPLSQEFHTRRKEINEELS